MEEDKLYELFNAGQHELVWQLIKGNDLKFDLNKVLDDNGYDYKINTCIERFNVDIVIRAGMIYSDGICFSNPNFYMDKPNYTHFEVHLKANHNLSNILPLNHHLRKYIRSECTRFHEILINVPHDELIKFLING